MANNIRLRRLTEKEVEKANYDGMPMLRAFDSVCGDFFAILEYEYGETSAEGSAWAAVEIET